MDSGSNIVVYAGLLIGLVYGAVGLLSGFCLMSSLRGWWAQGDSRLVRSYALALGVAIVATQLLAGGGMVDLGKSIYLQPSFSVPLMFFGGLLFGYGMVLSNGCGSRALVLLGRGNLRSLVVVIVLGIAAQMTLKGLIAPARVVLLQASQSAAAIISLPALMSTFGVSEALARMSAAAVTAGALIIFAFAHAPFQRAWGQIAAGVIVGLLIAAGWFATGYLGADDFNPAAVTSLDFHLAHRGRAAIRDAVDRIDIEFRHRGGGWRVRRKPGDGAGHATLSLGGLLLAAPHAALDQRRGADGSGWSDGPWLLGRPGPDGALDPGAGVLRRRRRDFAGRGRRPARRVSRAAIGRRERCAQRAIGFAGLRSRAASPRDSRGGLPSA